MALSQREKRMLAVPVLIGAVIGFYAYVHEPLFTRRAEAAEKEQQVSSQLKKDQVKLQREGNLAVRKEAVAAREQVIDAWVPGKNSAALLIWYLSQAEKKTGARIRSVMLSERRQVSASQARLSSTPPGQQEQPSQPAAPATPSQPGAQPTPPPAPGNEVMLTVIDLTLSVEGIFGQHQALNQELEMMPLFLDTKALSLTPISATQANPELVGLLIRSGNAQLASQLAVMSPRLTGTYQVSVFFKGEKMGPNAGVMTFSEDAGKIDPFAREFSETMLNFYSRQPNPDGSRGPLPPLPEKLKEQLG